MQEITADLLHEARALPGEGPSWWAEKGLLIWVDISGCKLNYLNPETRENRVVELPFKPGMAHPTTQGDIILGTSDGFARIDFEADAITPLANPEGHLEQSRFNDGKVGPDGRLYSGTMVPDAGGAFYVLDHDLSVRKLFEGVTVSNGLAWSADAKTFYYIDTPTQEVVAWDFDKDAGTLANKRTCLTFPKESGGPDGMCIDSEGMLWVAMWEGWGVGRWNPETGEQLAFIKLPCGRVTCPCFGGPDLDTLFITSSTTEKEGQPLGGSVFVCKPGVTGPKPFYFAG